jgi:hypothetical protein
MLSFFIFHHSRHAERAPRKISASTITMTTIGGDIGNDKYRVGKQLSSILKINVLCPGFHAG